MCWWPRNSVLLASTGPGVKFRLHFTMAVPFTDSSTLYCPDILAVNETLILLCPVYGVGSMTIGMPEEEDVWVTMHCSLSVVCRV